MQNLVYRKISRHHRIYGTFAIAFIAIGMLVGCNMSNDRSQSPNNRQLTGTWEFKNQDGSKNGSKNGNAIFVDQNGIEGDVYIVSNDGKFGKTAIAGKYKINLNTKPLQLDLTFGDLTTQTIYEISNDGQLKIANTFPEQVRPTILDPQSPSLIKVSDSTNLASDIKILRSPDLVSSSALIREAESKSYLRVIMRSQQQIFQEKGQFSTDINQLASGLKINSEVYSYKITIFDNASGLLVQNSAVPLKDGLKAYTGIVYVSNEAIQGNTKATKSILCESNISTKEIPTIPKKQDDGYVCSDSYTVINP